MDSRRIRGGVFGKHSLVEGRWQDVFAEAVTEARVASVQKASLERLIKSNSEFALRLFSSYPSGCDSPAKS